MATVHANKAFHLLNHEALTTCLKSSGLFRTLAFANELRNERASSDHRPPTSHHHQACPTVSLSEFGVGALFPNTGLDHGCPVCCCALPAQNRPCGPGTPLWCRSQAERHGTGGAHLPPLQNGDCRLRLLEASPDPGLGSSLSLSSRLFADTSCSALQREPPSPQNSCVRTSCAVVATWIEWTATPAT